MATIQDRIKQFLEYEGIRIKRFEIECDLGNGTVKSMGIGTRSLTYQKIAKRYPYLNTEWLRTGRGSMIIGESENGNSSQVDKSEAFKSVLAQVHETAPPGDIAQEKKNEQETHIEAMVQRCEHLLEKAEMLLSNATNVMQTTANLNAAMQIDRQNVQMLFKEVHEGQIENMRHSKEWFETYKQAIVDFESEIRSVIATQNEHAVERAKKVKDEILTTCGTADIADLKKNVEETCNILRKLPLGAIKASMR